MPASDYQSISKQSLHTYPMPEEPEYYIYFYHTDIDSNGQGDYIILPTYPENISDGTTVNYSSELPLGRSAPLQSYGGSGPRTILFNFLLHRDMMWQLNYLAQNTTLNVSVDDDYVDLMARKILAAALPEYAVAEKMVCPPMIAVRIGNEVFIKGVVTGLVGVSYKPPILRNGKYACIDIGFAVTEVTPYSASLVMKIGSYRNTGYSLGTNLIYTTNKNKLTVASNNTSDDQVAIDSNPVSFKLGESTVHVSQSGRVHGGGGGGRHF